MSCISVLITNLTFEREREERGIKDLEPMHQIKGLYPIHEMLEFYKEENLLHPTREHPGPNLESTRHLPVDCKKWECSICYSMAKFDSPVKYAAFPWQLGLCNLLFFLPADIHLQLTLERDCKQKRENVWGDGRLRAWSYTQCICMQVSG